MARISLAVLNAQLRAEIEELKIKLNNEILYSQQLKLAIDGGGLVDFDFNYTVAVAIRREFTSTVISCMPDKLGVIKEFKMLCTLERHQELVNEFARYKSKAK